jgi:hypothetical protein
MAGVAYDPHNLPKNTTKQTTINNQHISNASRNTGTIAYDPKNLPKNTTKQTTINNQHISNAYNNMASVAYDPQNIPKNTTKQTTINNQHISNAYNNMAGVAYDPKNLPKNTIKQTTINNQHISNAYNNTASVAYDPKNIPKNTIKQTTINNQHISNATQKIGTVTYDPNKWIARDTNRQTTQDNHHVPPGYSYDAVAPKLYDAEYNMQIDDRKQIIAMSGRAPTQTGSKIGPTLDASKDNIYHNKKWNDINQINKRENVPDYSNLNGLLRVPVNITHERNILPQAEIRLDNKILAGLDTNPFSIPSYFN